MGIRENCLRIREEIPDSVRIVLAAKARLPQEVEEAIEAGADEIGENYVQEAERMYLSLAEKAGGVKWHMIGHLQKNKIKRALKIFDCIQTVDSLQNAKDIDRIAESFKRVVPVYIEINIGAECPKAGVKPEYETVENLAREISSLRNLHLEGLMTIGPRSENPEDLRPYFRKTRDIFEKLVALNLPHVSIRTLSMGMSNSYEVAIEEGSNMIRLGTIIFGERKIPLPPLLKGD